MAATAIIAAIGLAAALGSTAYGAAQQKKAEKLRQSNIRPTYTIAPEILENQRISEYRAGFGLPEHVKQYYRQGSERGLTTSVDKILKGGGSPNDVVGAYNIYNDSLAKLAIADDERQYKNIQNLLENNRYMESVRDKEFQVNKYGPYADKARLAAEMSQAGANYIQSGINTGANAIGTYAGSMARRKSVDDVLGSAGNLAGGGTSGTQYDPSLMNSAAGRNYLSNSYQNTYSRMTPEQRAVVNSLYGNRFNLDLSAPDNLNYFNANSYRY